MRKRKNYTSGFYENIILSEGGWNPVYYWWGKAEVTPPHYFLFNFYFVFYLESGKVKPVGAVQKLSSDDTGKFVEYGWYTIFT